MVPCLQPLPFPAQFLTPVASKVDEQRDLALAEIRAHGEFSHPNLMPLIDCAIVGVPQGEVAYLLFPFMNSECRRSRVSSERIEKLRNAESDESFYQRAR